MKRIKSVVVWRSMSAQTASRIMGFCKASIPALSSDSAQSGSNPPGNSSLKNLMERGIMPLNLREAWEEYYGSKETG
jgi:hypothetical protein